MQRTSGIVASVAACLVFLAVLVWPYTQESFRDVNIYYASGALNPLFAGVLAGGVVVAILLTRTGSVTRDLGVGIALGLGLIVLVVVAAWAVTGRVDIFLAPGWAFPAQRWILLGLSVVAVLGTGWYTWVYGLLARSAR